MNDQNGNDRHRPAMAEVRLLDLGAVFLKRWRTVLGTAAVLMVLGGVIRLVLPQTYTARTVLLPANDPAGGRGSALGAQLSGLVGLAQGPSQNERIVTTVLNSRTMADSMVARVVPKGTPEEKAQVRYVLAQEMELETKDGAMHIKVTDEDAERAAAIANTLPLLANRMLTEIGVETALRKQGFIERQLATARGNLEESEERLLEFQEGRDAPELQDQARRTLDAAAQLQQTIIEQEIQIAQLRRTVTADNPRLRAAVDALAARREQLRRLTAGSRGGNNALFLPLGESPGLKIASTRLLRDFTKNEQVYLSLTGALAQTQIDVNNNLPTVTVLDEALVPGRPSGPGMPLVLFLAGVAGLLVGTMAAFAAEHMERARREATDEQFFAAWDQFKVDVSGIVPGRGGRVRAGQHSVN